jgi:4-hydroxy-tetrahydrodipicolinate synthase
MHPLAGVFCAAVTPLKADYSPDLEAIPPWLAFLAGRGCHGILLLGTTGEGPSFSPEERLAIFRAAFQVRALLSADGSSPCKLLAGTGTPSLSETVTLTRSAFDLGIDGAVVLPPYYFRKATDEGLFRYFEQLIRKAVPSDGFLLGYHFPSAAGIGFSLELLSRLKEAFPHQFAGIKDSSHDAEFARQLGERFGNDLLVLTGTDSYLQMALENQASGCITAPANLISPELRRLWDAFQNHDDTAALQGRITLLRGILDRFQPFPPLLKALLAEKYGFPRWPVRPPLVETSSEAVDKALVELEALPV